MEGARSSIPARSAAIVEATSPGADESGSFYFQEQDDIPYYDSFDEYDDSEDYAEMSAPTEHARTVSVCAEPCVCFHSSYYFLTGA